MGGIGAFAGGLASGYFGGKEAQSRLASEGETTEAKRLANEATRNHRANLQELGRRLDAWKAGGQQGPAPTIGDLEPTATETGAAGAAATNAAAATPAANPGRAQLADQLKGLGFHSLAAGVSAGDSAAADEPVPMLTQPGANGIPQAMTANPPLPNLQQIAAQAAAAKKPAYDPANTFGA